MLRVNCLAAVVRCVHGNGQENSDLKGLYCYDAPVALRSEMWHFGHQQVFSEQSLRKFNFKHQT